MKILKFALNDRRCEVATYEQGLTLLYIEGRKTPLNAKATWTFGQYKCAVVCAMIADAMAKSAQAIAPIPVQPIAPVEVHTCNRCGALCPHKDNCIECE